MNKVCSEESTIVISVLLIGLLCLIGTSGGSWRLLSSVAASSSCATDTSAQSVDFNFTVTLSTSMGTIVIGLFDDMPITTGNFKNLTQLGYYDGTIFHRVVHDFVIQGGDLSGKGIVVPKIPDELPNKHSNIRGSLAMAKTTQPNSATSQFYINLVNNTYLDTNYSVFGQVIEGMNVVDNIGSVPTDVDERPLQDVTVLTALLQAIPEYASWIFLVLFMVAVMFIVMIHKKNCGKDLSSFVRPDVSWSRARLENKSSLSVLCGSS